jgi:hypothetical protein
MKKFLIAVITLTLLSVSSCKKSSTSSTNTSTTKTGYTPDCSGSTPSFSATVSSLVVSSCGGSGCHNTGSSKGPGPLTNYTQIKNSASSVRSSVVSGNMPVGSTLTTAQKNTIVCWIDAGTPNN